MESEVVNLPTIYSSTLSTTELQHLFDDLSAFAVVQEVQEKGSSSSLAEKESFNLATVYDHLTRKTCRGVQLRYVLHHETWIDTLIVVEDGFRIVRMRVDLTDESNRNSP